MAAIEQRVADLEQQLAELRTMLTQTGSALTAAFEAGRAHERGESSPAIRAAQPRRPRHLRAVRQEA